MSRVPSGAALSHASIRYLSPPSPVNMADAWFDIASVDHFWIRRRFEVFRRLAGELIPEAEAIAEIGCGHGLLQRQIEEKYGREVVGIDLNETALQQNVSRSSPLCCYDIFQKDSSFSGRFDLIFLFDVLEHIADEDGFLSAALFHLAPDGAIAVNVPAGQWAYSAYDRAAGHVRRYSIRALTQTAARNGLRISAATYWGFPLLPTLIVRKLWLMGKHDADQIISTGFDSRSERINRWLGALSRCEPIPQRFLGTSLMAVLRPVSRPPGDS